MASAPARRKGGEPPASSVHDVPLPLGGVRGGTAPCQPLPGTREAWPQRVSWLIHLRVAQASPADTSETLPRAAPNGGHRAVAGKLVGISVASLTGDEDDGRPVTS